MRSSNILIALATAGLLAACGQKGPLYLPDPAGLPPDDADSAIKAARPVADDDSGDLPIDVLVPATGGNDSSHAPAGHTTTPPRDGNTLSRQDGRHRQGTGR